MQIEAILHVSVLLFFVIIYQFYRFDTNFTVMLERRKKKLNIYLKEIKKWRE
jgi:hypothetical protein